MESSILLELTGKAKPGHGKKMAEHLLESGHAWRKFQQIITAQGKKRIPPLAKYSKNVVSPKTGRVKSIENKSIAHLARIAGAPKDSAAGLFLRKKIGDRVKKGEALYTIYASSEDRLKYALEFAKNTGYQIA